MNESLITDCNVVQAEAPQVFEACNMRQVLGVDIPPRQLKVLQLLEG